MFKKLFAINESGCFSAILLKSFINTACSKLKNKYET